eukprot:1195859-Prorocentrum_minimum.AAC.3
MAARATVRSLHDILTRRGNNNKHASVARESETKPTNRSPSTRIYRAHRPITAPERRPSGSNHNARRARRLARPLESKVDGSRADRKQLPQTLVGEFAALGRCRAVEPCCGDACPPSNPLPRRLCLTAPSSPLPSGTFAPLRTYRATHLEDASGILRFSSGSEAHEARYTRPSNPLARLVRTAGTSDLPSRDWFAPREYPTSPYAIGCIPSPAGDSPPLTPLISFAPVNPQVVFNPP